TYFRVPRESKGHGTRIKFPELLVDPAPPPDSYLDDETGRPLALADGQPLVLFGRTVVRDKRLKGKAKGKAGLTPEQLRARRNEDWRVDHEVGRIDPETGRFVTRTIAMIAVLEGIPERTVRHGINQARKKLNAVREAVGAC
ncbi:hypothetical protein ACYOEI_22805, partial [Singulisphaera rosea]